MGWTGHVLSRSKRIKRSSERPSHFNLKIYGSEFSLNTFLFSPDPVFTCLTTFDSLPGQRANWGLMRNPLKHPISKEELDFQGRQNMKKNTPLPLLCAETVLNSLRLNNENPVVW